MVRAVVPIFIEKDDIIIHGIKELEQYAQEHQKGYAILHRSGLAQQLSHAFRKVAPEPQVALHHEEGCDPLLLQDDHDLLASIYRCATSTVANNARLFGVHRHQTSLQADGQFIEISARLSISYATISDAHLIVKSGATLRLQHAIADQVIITVESGGRLELSDVEICGCHESAINVHKDGVIALAEDVSFYDVDVNYTLHYATQENTGKVVDLDDSDAFVDFLDESVVLEAEIETDFAPTRKALRFNQPVCLINTTNRSLNAVVPNITIDTSLTFRGEFNVHGHVHIEEASGVKLMLADFFGSITAKNSDEVLVENTRFMGQETHIALFKSEMTLQKCYFTELHRAIRLDQSSLVLNQCEIKQCQDFINGHKSEIAEDDLLLDDFVRDCDVLISNSKFEEVNVILNSPIIKEVKLNNNLFTYTENAFVVNDTRLDAELCRFVRNEHILKVDGGYAELRECEFMDDASVLNTHGINLENAILINGGGRAKLVECVLEHYKTASRVEDGVIELNTSVVRQNRKGVELINANARLEHYLSEFIQAPELRAIVRFDGAEVIDLKELEDMEQWQQEYA